MLRVKKGRVTYLPKLAYKPPLPDEEAPRPHHSGYENNLSADLDCPSSLWQEDHRRFVAYKGQWSVLDGGRVRKAGNDVRYGRDLVNKMKEAAVNLEQLSPGQQRRKMVNLMALGVRMAARKSMPIKYVDVAQIEDILHADQALLAQAFGAVESALHVDLGGELHREPPPDCKYLLTRRIWRILGKTTLAPGLMGYIVRALAATNAHPALVIALYTIFAQTQYVYDLPIGNAWGYQLNLDRYFRAATLHVCPSPKNPSDNELANLCTLFSKYNHETGLPPNVPFCGRIESLIPPTWMHVFLKILRDRQYPCDGRTFAQLALRVSKVSPSARQDLVDYHLQQSQRWWYLDESIFSLMYLMCNRGDAEASIEVMNSKKFADRLLDEKTRMGAFRMLLYRAVKFEGMRDAVSVFQTMKEKNCPPDLHCYGLLIHGYKERGYYEEAISHTLDVAAQSKVPVEIATDYFEAVAKSKDLREALAVYCQLFTPHSLQELGIFAYVLRGSAQNKISVETALSELPQLPPKQPGFELYRSDAASLNILYRALLTSADQVEQVRALYEKYRDLLASVLSASYVPPRWRWLKTNSGFELMSTFVAAVLRCTGDISQCLLLIRDFIDVAKVNMFAPEVFNTLVKAACISGRFDLAEETLRLAMAIKTPTNKVVFMPLEAHMRAGRVEKAEVFWDIATQNNDAYSYLERTAVLLPIADEHGWRVPGQLREAVAEYLAKEEARKEARAAGYAKDDSLEQQLLEDKPKPKAEDKTEDKTEDKAEDQHEIASQVGHQEA